MKHKRSFFLWSAVILCLALLAGSAAALDESEVQDAISASSKEEVSGDVFIWFLCAVAFLKVSQKIDSFMSSLGINVGRTGGSMLGELMIAGRAIAGTVGAVGHGFTGLFSRNHNSAHTAAGQTHVTHQVGHGVVGMTQQAARNAAVSAASGKGKGIGGAMGGAMFRSSLKRGGQFSTDVTRSIATGSIRDMGLMTGPVAAQALTSYMGYEEAGSASEDETVILQGNTSGGAQTPPESSESIPSAPVGSSEYSFTEDHVTINGGTAAAGTAAPSGGGSSVPESTIPLAPHFTNVEIGGGRISGFETPAAGGESRQFIMYNASQYTEPSGEYETVKSVDGESWYRQYAQPAVEKTPKEVSGRGVKYDEKIVMKMPPVPRRKDSI